ncbi:MAG: isoleucine--tRNA ligase [Planctomycetota bacterium]
MSTPSERPYPAPQPSPDFPAIEERILARWATEGTFGASIEQRKREGAPEFVFYDGPPFASGLPHYGHILTGYVKDIVPRYQTMRGKRVERRFGWDCHGLPAEMGTEQILGVSGRANITEYGIDRFNQACREAVLKYTDEWERYVTRMARWVDFQNDYKTMDLSYMESVLWAFKELWKKGLVYESYRVMPYSWAAETVVSNFETRLDDSYRERQDPAVTVRFELAREHEGEPLEIWVWTTTPWTLPSNLALAVGAAIDYAVYRRDGRRFVIGEGASEKYAAELEGADRVGTLPGSELVGATYTPLFPYFAGHANAFRVLGADFVDTSEGTGVVHLAPGFGEDDQAVCEAEGIALVCPVDDSGRYTSEVSDWAGVNVLEANRPIVKHLKAAGQLVRHETYLHNYPHCWRTDQPLIYRAVSSWYVRVTEFRDRMVELNREIHWIPEHIRDGQFGRWLENARDWSISRNRFWGAPIPIWKSDDPNHPRIDVYGSLDELERDFGVRPTDLHRPAIDELTRPNPDDPTGKSTMRRVEEVFDCWFESGSMPYAQVHYPMENREWFENHFPADFIVEYVAQTRGWFYTMMVLSTALFDKPPFQNVICHGVVLDETGQKLSKRLKNYPDPEEVFRTEGADALRWFLCSSPILRGADLHIDRDGKAIAEVKRLVLNPIWNAYSFFCLYANASGVTARFHAEAEGVLDRYLLAKTHNLIKDVEGALDAYDLSAACLHVRAFLDSLNNWYIRRSRTRFWATDVGQEERDAFDTLYTVLVTFTRVTAPLLPLITEEIHTGLVGEGRSVHLEDWPSAASFLPDDLLVDAMDLARDACSATLGLREDRRLRVRLPLASVTIAGPDVKQLEPYRSLIQDEVNVKEVRLIEDVERFARFELKPNARVLGPKVGKRMKEVLSAARAGKWERTEDGVALLDLTLAEGEYELALVPNSAAGELAVASIPGRDALVALDVHSTPELEREGLARDVVRQVQIARRAAELDVSDRIHLWVSGDDAVEAAVREHEAYLREQVFAVDVRYEAPAPEASTSTTKLNGSQLQIGVARA